MKIPTVQTTDSYNIAYKEPEEHHLDSMDTDDLLERIPLISSKGWERSFSFCKEKMNDGRYRYSYLIYDPTYPYIQPISDDIKTILGKDYTPSMPRSTIILCYLSGILFNRFEKMLDNRTLRWLADLQHDDIAGYLKRTKEIDRITFKITDYCHATGRERPNKLTYKCILNQLSNCTTLIGAILKDPDDPGSADYFHVVEDLGYKEGIVTFRSRYMAMLVAKMIQSDITKNENGNMIRKSKKSTASKPMHSYHMGADFLKERSLYAIDIIGNICVLMDQAGKHPGVKPHITYDTLIQRSGTIKHKDESTICRAFREAWKLLPMTDLNEKYPGIKFPDPKVSISKDMIKKETLTLPHNCTECKLDRCNKKKCPQKVVS